MLSPLEDEVCLDSSYGSWASHGQTAQDPTNSRLVSAPSGFTRTGIEIFIKIQMPADD
jgi:hypothetical protein